MVGRNGCLRVLLVILVVDVDVDPIVLVGVVFGENDELDPSPLPLPPPRVYGFEFCTEDDDETIVLGEDGATVGNRTIVGLFVCTEPVVGSTLFDDHKLLPLFC